MSDNNCIYLGSTDFFQKRRIVFIGTTSTHVEVIARIQKQK